ncbi:MAG: sigma factor-like helix-turn-helix DNA-binding protein [Polyangia bacterium]|jgi:hypothetical protein
MADELRINIFKITRGGCRKLPGPCPHAVCRFNLTSERRDSRGAKPASVHLPVVREACALEAAEQGGMTLEEIALRLSLTRERVRQIELGALKKLWARLGGDEGEAEVEHESDPAVAGLRRAARVAA